MMIDIETLRGYCKAGKIFVTEHSAMRLREREIKMKDIRQAILNGEIIEQYPDDFPYPSCLVLGVTSEECPLHIVLSNDGDKSQLITAYIPDKDKWSEDFRKRRN